MLDDNSVDLFAGSNVIARQRSDVEHAVFEVTGVPIYKLLEPCRKADIAAARFLLVYCLRRMCRMTYPAIADFIGYDNHTSAMHGEKEIDRLLSNGDPDACSAVKRVYAILSMRESKAKS
jgi:chromosomal replication initiation ATPase DnaA